MQRRPARLTMTVRHLQQRRAKFALLVRLLGRRRMVAEDRPNLQAGRCKRSNLAAEAFQWRISASAKSQRGRVFVAEEKKSELRRRSLI